MKRFLSLPIIQKFWPISFLFILTVILFLANVHSGTWLIGWDNLMPGFSFSINIQRSFFAVWQEYQSLGLLGGMGHASDLIRQLFLAALSLFLPPNLLRYIWTFLVLFLGASGAYLLGKYLLKTENKLIPLAAALFYMLNLATMQTFYVPFESFINHFGFLPWILYASLLYLDGRQWKYLAFLCLVLLIATPQAYIPTLFVVTMISIAIFIFATIVTKFTKATIIRCIKLVGIIFAVNAFWLLPFLYFTATNVQVNLNSRINQMVTESIFLQNKEFGDIVDVAALKGFWFNTVDPNLQGSMAYMLAPWKIHLSNGLVGLLALIPFLLALIGFIYCLRKRDRNGWALAFLFIFSLIALAVATPPFSWMNTLVRTYFPVLNQAFRFPDTKFSILTALSYTLLIAFALQSVSNWSKHHLPLIWQRVLPSIVGIILAVSIFTVAFPAFQGHLFYQKEQLNIPKEYFGLFNFFKHQDPNTRIADLPQQTFWGWNSYSWGYGGSGFLWYGIKQPILDRAFDTWSADSENYYYELTQALYSQNPKQFKQVLNKYQVTWLLVDHSIINPSAPKALFFTGIQSIISQNSSIKLAWHQGNLYVYKVALDQPAKSFVAFSSALPTANPYSWTETDQAYLQHGNYSTTSTTPELYYPFRSLPTNRTTPSSNLSIQNQNNQISFSEVIPASKRKRTLEIPSFAKTESIVAVKIYVTNDDNGGKQVTLAIQTPEVYINNQFASGGSVEVKAFDIPQNSPQKLILRVNQNEVYTIDQQSQIYQNTFLSLNQPNYLVLSTQDGQVVAVQTFNTSSINNTGILNSASIPVNPSSHSQTITVLYPRIDDKYLSFSLNTQQVKPYDCNPFRVGTNNSSISSQTHALTFFSNNDTYCSGTYAPNLLHNIGYVLFGHARNISGQPLHFWVLNEEEDFTPLDTYLPQSPQNTQFSYIMAPMENHGKAYSFHFDNESIGNDPTKNVLYNFSAYPFPYTYLTSIAVSSTLPSPRVTTTLYDVQHPNESLYIINTTQAQKIPSNLLLYQAYDQGWFAYSFSSQPSFFDQFMPFIGGKKLNTHFKLSNWANGWTIQNTQSYIVIVYMPQYLEYIGFILLLGVFIVMGIAWRKNKPLLQSKVLL